MCNHNPIQLQNKKSGNTVHIIKNHKIHLPWTFLGINLHQKHDSLLKRYNDSIMKDYFGKKLLKVNVRFQNKFSLSGIYVLYIMPWLHAMGRVRLECPWRKKFSQGISVSIRDRRQPSIMRNFGSHNR